MAAGAELDALTDLGHNEKEQAERLAPLHLAAGQAAALGKWSLHKTALEVAVTAGAAGAAAALLAAGASIAVQVQWGFLLQHQTVFGELPALAWRKAKEPGADAPAALQQMAAALLSRGLPAGPAADTAHSVAVELAYPYTPVDGSPGCPPCPWLLQHLLQLHISGQLGAAYAPAVEAALLKLIGRSETHPISEAAAAQWLNMPAAASLSVDRLQYLGCQLLKRGLAGEALAALLALPTAPEALQQHAQEHLRDWMNARHMRSLVAGAAATERPEVLDAVLAAGGTITLNDVNALATNQGWVAPRALPLMLSRGVPPVPANVPPVQVVPWSSCPIYALLECFPEKQGEASCCSTAPASHSCLIGGCHSLRHGGARQLSGSCCKWHCSRDALTALRAGLGGRMHVV